MWEWDTPVDMKYIAEPNMHTMPFVSLSHDGKCERVCQDLVQDGV